MARTSDSPWLNRHAFLTAFVTLILVCVGGLVTSNGAGMAVPDWPNTFGYNMFFFPVSKWVGNIFYEHTHRLVASGVGLLTVVLAVWLWKSESRRWLRWMGVIALVAVILQGVLGGLRVVLFKDEIGIFHATLAQLFFVLVCAISLLTSPWWRHSCSFRRTMDDQCGLRWMIPLTAVLIFVQLVIGATMRHQHAGLTVPDFPTAYGKWWPDTDEAAVATYNLNRTEVNALNPITAAQVGLHMAHRLTAAVILLAVAGCSVLAVRMLGRSHPLSRLALVWSGLILIQALLGAATVWTGKSADIATAHVAFGALSLMTGAMAGIVALRTLSPRRIEVRNDLPTPSVPAVVITGVAAGPEYEAGDLMKATAQPLSVHAVTGKSRMAVLSELIKARLTFLVLMTALVGFYLGQRGPVDWVLMFHTMLGTGLLASGAAALNQVLEHRYDALMRRTQDRPVPSGRLHPDTALMFGAAASAFGLLYLALTVNELTSVLGALTLVSYLFIYTPLKRVTTLNTVIGAIPGALPPLMGWTAARGEVSLGGWALFAILFFWQLPHFLAIAWLYREDYANAGFAMLPVYDRSGHRTGRSAVSHTLGLLPVSLTPYLLGLSGVVYVCGALVLGAAFAWQAVQFSRELSERRARQLFFVSILYLPLLLGLMVVDKIR